MPDGFASCRGALAGVPWQALCELAERFWRWRRSQQPHTRDDIPRVQRPVGWSPDWSSAAVAGYRQDVSRFEAALSTIDASSEPVPVRVDLRLLQSAVHRVRFELDVLRLWRRNPGFYPDQALGAVHAVLLLSQPVSPDRIDTVIRLLRRVPTVLGAAEENLLGHAEAEFTAVMLTELADAGERLRNAIASLCLLASHAQATSLTSAASVAAAAVEEFCDLWATRLPTLPPVTPIGSAALQRYLAGVCLLPWSIRQIGELGEAEQARATVGELLTRAGGSASAGAAAPAVSGAEAQCAAHAVAERRVRRFYRSHGLLSQPAGLPRYLHRPMPAYLEPLRWLGVSNDLAAEGRPADDGIGYVRQPRADLGYFEAAYARDSRLAVVHDGAHQQQLTRSWGHPDPIRRRFYDSAPNEGIAFYNEEAMLAAGLFDDSRASRQVVYNLMRLRAVRVGVDLGLATGRFSIQQAAAQLAEHTSLDRSTAMAEAILFVTTPGQGLSYQVGKTQIQLLLADACRRDGAGFVLQDYHDYLWDNGNLPFALLRWECLGDRGWLDEADRLMSDAPLPG